MQPLSKVYSSAARQVSSKQSELKRTKRKVHSSSGRNESDTYNILMEYEYEYENDRRDELSHLLAHTDLSENPQIDRYHTSNVTALAGATASLNCRVHKLGNKTVSWIHGETLHLLAVGRYTYTSDLRFEASHVPHSLDWSLVLRNPQKSDSGLYQCQVSSTPPLSQDVWLQVKGKVIEPGLRLARITFHSKAKMPGFSVIFNIVTSD